MNREYKVLSVLHRAFPYAPQAYLYCDDRDIIGADFFVMQRRHGVVVRRSLLGVYPGQAQVPRRMSLALIDALAQLHAVDYAAVGLAELGRPTGYIERQIEGWYKRWHAAKTEDLAEMDAVYGWLKGHLPMSADVSLLHNDYKLDNVMLALDDPGRLVAIFDWDMCTLGDPLADLGALLAYWSEPGDPAYLQMTSMMPTGDLGFPTRAELVERYAEKSGRSVENITFYHTLGLFRIVVIIAQIYIRYVRGQTLDQRFAAMGPTVPLMARAAQALAFGS
jgi:aminoglycoside phosphotransferase (APT) family kinase protein